MVGVPGRSKACHTCRQRRIKCDGGRPGCRNCARSHRICSGYQRQHAFILSKDMGVDESQNSKEDTDSGTVLVSRWKINQEPGASANSPVPSNLKSEPVLSLRTGKSSSSQTSTSDLPSIIRGLHTRHAFRNQLLSFFLGAFLPLDVSPGIREPVRNKIFLLHLADLNDLSPALENAVLAVCTSRLGQLNGQEHLCHASLSLYTDSLRELRRAVLDPNTRCDDHTLAACAILTMYEFAECPGKVIHGYFAHVTGAMRLLRLRGAEAFKDGLPHSIFYTLRMQAVFQALGEHTTTFLSHESWRTIPFATSQKGLYDEILDILLELPGILSAADDMETETDQHKLIRHAVDAIRRCWKLDHTFASWYVRLEASVAGPLYWPELTTAADSKADDPELGKLFPVQFHFPSLILAQTIMLYWIGQIITYCHLRKVYARLERIAATAAVARGEDDGGEGGGRGGDGNDGSDAVVAVCSCDNGWGYVVIEGADDVASVPACLVHFRPEMLPPLGHRERPRAVAKKVCQSVHFFLQDRMGYVGISTSVPPLIFVRLYLDDFGEDCKREKIWIQETLQEINGKGGKLAVYI